LIDEGSTSIHRKFVLTWGFKTRERGTQWHSKKNLRFYKSKLPELAANEGKYVLIHDDSIIDVYGTYEDALKEGYGRFHLEPFLVKQIHAMEQVQSISRLLSTQPCHTSPAR